MTSREAFIMALSLAFGTWFGQATEDYHRADQRSADLRMIQAAKDRCFIPWGKRDKTIRLPQSAP